MPVVTITLEDTPTGGVSIHTTFKPAIGAPCSRAQSAALDIMRRANKEWNGSGGHGGNVLVSSRAPSVSSATLAQVDTLTRVRNRIAEHVARPLTAEDDAKHLVNDLEADSLDLVEIGMDMEDSFDIILTDDETERCHTVTDFATLVQAKLDQKANA